MKYSFVIPVFNRPDEISELLESLSNQTFKDFEVIIVEDGSKIDCKKEVEQYKDKLDIKYFYKKNERPAIARNYGVAHAKGEYVIFVDSDVIVPQKYLEIVDNYLRKNQVDAYGGPDAAAPNFNALQKAISYAMTSFITSGKIRSGQKIDRYYPRSFNMGIKRQVFINLNGFPKIWPAEDIVFAIEIIRNGYKTALISEAYVYHKRRNTIKSFFGQVFRFGKTRYIISRVYPETFKIFYLFPSLFVLGTIVLLFLSLWKWWFILPILLYAFIVFIDSLIKNKSFKVAILSIIIAFVQHFGYGLGFLIAIFKGDKYNVVKNGFYQKNNIILTE